MVTLVLQVALYGLYIAVMVFGIFVGGMELAQWYRTQSFRGLIREKIATCSYEHIKQLAEGDNQSRSQVLKALQLAFRYAVKEGWDDKKLEHILAMLKEHENGEAFAELPENIRTQLSALKVGSPGKANEIVHLASSMTEIYSKNRRDFERQKRLTYIGLGLGVLGVCVGLFPEAFKGV